MDASSEPVGLRAAFVDAYPRYVAAWMHDRRIDMDPVVADAVVEGAAVLDGLLAGLESQPVLEQRQSPLELFGEALRPIDRALSVIGVEPTGAGGGRPAWDRYGLVPGSSHVLGPAAHEAHLRWGVAKASVMAPLVRPRARVHPPGDLDVASAVEQCGYVPVEGDLDAAIVVVRAGTDRAHEAIRSGAAVGAYVVVHGRVIDDLEAVGVKALGASAVVTTDALLASPSDHLPKPV